jgi:hypothetical protein
MDATSVLALARDMKMLESMTNVTGRATDEIVLSSFECGKQLERVHDLVVNRQKRPAHLAWVDETHIRVPLRYGTLGLLNVG